MDQRPERHVKTVRPGPPPNAPRARLSPSSSSSNHLLADRRFAWARGLAEAGDHAAAADLLDQAVALVPGWAPGWAALAEARERAGDGDGAIAAWLKVAALDVAGMLGAEPHLARLRGRTPAGLPEPYVRALFDDYAPRFDRHLVEALDYRGPEVVLAALERAAPGRRFGRALDLGCGTGLMGRALSGRVGAIDGVDLSPAMVALAREAGCYASLTAGPLEDALSAGTDRYDLVTAADVFVYLGDLAPVLAAAARALTPGGVLAFTVQAHHDGFALGADMRFGHSESHLREALAAAGLGIALLEPASTRREAGHAVPGTVAVARR